MIEGWATTRADHFERVELAHTSVLIVGCCLESIQDFRRFRDRSVLVIDGDLLLYATKLAVLSEPFLCAIVRGTRE